MKVLTKPYILTSLLLVVGTGVILAYIFIYFNQDLNTYIAMREKLHFQKKMTTYIMQNTKSMQANVQDKKAVAVGNMLNDVTIEHIIDYYIHELTIKKVHTASLAQGVVQERFFVQGTIQSPTQFYALVDFITKNSYPLAIDYPIHFVRKGNVIAIDFYITLYRLAPQSDA